jgi:AraC family transcriptional regulator
VQYRALKATTSLGRNVNRLYQKIAFLYRILLFAPENGNWKNMRYSAFMNNQCFSFLPISNDPKQVLAYSPASVSCLPITVMPIAAEAELKNYSCEMQQVLVAHQARGRRWYRLGGHTREMTTSPGMIEIRETGQGFDHCRWEGAPGCAVIAELDNALIQFITQDELPKLTLHTRHEILDGTVGRILLALAEETLSGNTNGPLYSQGLCVSLIGVMAKRYNNVGTKKVAVSSTESRLSAGQQKRVIALMREHMDINLSLMRMAQEIGLSTYHFARVFKSTFGSPPHRYAQNLRINAAADALRNKRQSSIADIALAHGFSSQAHMTDLIRRRFGVTPRALRR